MAWTTPPTIGSGAVPTPAQLNVIAADLNETFVAKATGLSDLFTSPPYGVATAANAVTGRQAVSSVYVNPGTTTSSTATSSLTDVLDPTVTQTGPQVTVTTGTKALAFLESTVQNSTTSTSTVVYAVDGVTDGSNLISLTAAAANQQMTAAGIRMITGLTAGVHTITMQYAVSAATTGTFNRRFITVLPF